jgi:CrcB protein
MWKSVALVFCGGAAGAVLRELFMLLTPRLSDNFPLDILAANLLACCLLGVVTALVRRRVVSGEVSLLLGTGVAGGLSTFSSFAYGTVVLLSSSAPRAEVAALYVLSSLLLGYLAVVLGAGLATGSRS